LIFEFGNYQKYLQEYLKRLPNQGHGEALKLAKYLGVSSTFVSHVLSGVRMLTPEQGELLSEYLGHSELEADYFFYLIQLERAGTQRLKKYCNLKLSEIKSKSLKLVNRVKAKRLLSDEEKSIFYSSPLYSAVHLYTSTGKGGRSLEEIMTRFELTRARASDIIRFLKDAGIVSEDEGKFHMGTQSTHVPQGSPHLLKHHANWRIKAIQASENLTENELMYTAQVSLSAKDFESIREDLAQTIKKILDKVHTSPADEIACFNLDWIWIKK